MKLKAAVLQTKVFADKEKNIRQLEEILSSGRTEGADLVTLPEMFACPYETKNFPIYAEPEGGPTWQALSALAAEYGIYLSAGSIPELEEQEDSGSGSVKQGERLPESVTREENVPEAAKQEDGIPGSSGAAGAETGIPGFSGAAGAGTGIPGSSGAAGAETGIQGSSGLTKTETGIAELSGAAKPAEPEGPTVRVYNTAYVFGRDGRQIGKHRKAHMFDIQVSGGQYFRESDTLSPGDRIGCFDTEFGRMGLCVCYDFRFPETARLMAQDGAKVILVPAAFNMTTGPAHWELMFRQRAVESQCYVIGTAPARDPESSYISWGHSIAVDPWGTVMMQMDEKEDVRIVELDLDYLEKVRSELPLLAHRRTDLYELRRL